MQGLLRALPSVDALIGALAGESALAGVPRPRLAAAVREALNAERRRLLEAGGPAAGRGRPRRPDRGRAHPERRLLARPRDQRDRRRAAHQPRPRAALPARAASGCTRWRGLLEPRDGRVRGRSAARATRTSRACCGGSPARRPPLVVNNCAAAVLLALESLARGKEVIVSRGELIEIGGEFRIPDIMRRSGARAARGGHHQPHPPQGLRSAPSVPRRACSSRSTPPTTAWSASPPRCRRASWPSWAARAACTVMEDLGSGCLVDLTRYGFPYEPTVPEVVASGVDLVSFSRRQAPGRAAGGHRGRAGRAGGAPRAQPAEPGAAHRQVHHRRARGDALRLRGGRPRSRRFPPCGCSPSRSRRFAAARARCSRRTGPAALRALGAAVVESSSQVGGGALPTVELPSAVIALGTRERPAEGLDEALRAGHPPVLGPLLDDRLLLDCRTVLPADVAALAARLAAL